MDIQVASNFERYLYYLYGCDPVRTKKNFDEFASTGRIHFTEDLLQDIQEDFASKSVNQDETLDTIRQFHRDHDYLLDPHTAVGVNAARECRSKDIPVVCLATAHPAKFGDAVLRAVGSPPELPYGLRGLDKKESRCEVLSPDVKTVKDFIVRHALV